MKNFRFITGCVLLFLAGLLIGNNDSLADRTYLWAGWSKQKPPVKDRSPAVPSKYDLVLREIAKEKQSNFDEGIAFPPMDTTFRAFDNAWDISDKLASILDLDRKERSKAQQCIDLSKIEFERLVTENSMLAQPLRGVEPAAYTFRIRPFMRSGHNELEALHGRLVKQLGKDKGDELFHYFRWRPNLGAFGANDVEITFGPPRSDKNSTVRFTRRKSMTGVSISSGEITEEQLLSGQGFKRSMFR